MRFRDIVNLNKDCKFNIISSSDNPHELRGDCCFDRDNNKISIELWRECELIREPEVVEVGWFRNSKGKLFGLPKNDKDDYGYDFYLKSLEWELVEEHTIEI